MQILQKKVEEDLKISETTKLQDNTSKYVENMQGDLKESSELNSNQNVDFQKTTNNQILPTNSHFKVHNAVSCIHEYAIKLKINVEFQV